MSTKISEQFDRIEGAVGDIKTAISNKGTTVPSGAKIGDLAPLISSIRPQVNLQSKYVLPQGESRTVTADADYDGLSSVIVGAIPSKYKDVTAVDATAADVLSPKKIVDKNGNVLTGAIPSVEGGIIAPSPDSLVIAIEGGTYAKDRIQIAPIPDKYKDTTGANAVASQVVEGIGFVGKSGVVEDGALLIYKNTQMAANVVNKTSNAVTIRTPFENPMYVANALYCDVPFEQFGDADEWHVAEGHTFTSANGFKVTGKIPVYDYTPIEAEYSDETDEGFIFMGSVDSGALMEDEINLEVSKERFGDAEASHVLKDKTFTSVDGYKKKGELEKYDNTRLDGLAAGAEENNVIVVTHFEDPKYVEGNSYVYSNIPLEGFGNATASDVRVGKTFTSSAGLKEDGTMPNVGVPAPTFTAQLDDDDDSGNTVWLRASVSQSAGYTAGGNNSTDIFPKLTVSGPPLVRCWLCSAVEQGHWPTSLVRWASS